MKYRLEDILLRTVTKAGPNQGSKFIQATVVNPDDEWDEPGRMTTFNEKMVAKLTQYVGLATQGPNDAFGRPTWIPGMLLDASKPLPENLLVFSHASFEEFVFPCPMCQIDENGEPRRNQTSGNLIIRTSIRVLCKKTVDNETGVSRWAKGWSPEEQGASIMATFYKPASEFLDAGPQGVQLPISPATPLINGASAQQAAPAQPATAPGAAAPAAPTV